MIFQHGVKGGKEDTEDKKAKSSKEKKELKECCVKPPLTLFSLLNS